jgi:lipopolysaccharide export system permease protein
MRLRPRLSPVIDRFLAGQFFGPFMVCVAAFTAAYLLGDMFDRFNDLIKYGGLGLLGLEYFALKIPLIVTQILPVACLAGVLLGFAILNRSGEVLACQQLGISRLEMAIPVMFAALLIGAFNFVLAETVVPRATRQAKYLYHVEMKKRQLQSVFSDKRIWIRLRSGFASADAYDKKRAELQGVTVYHIGEDYSVRDIVYADRADWNGHLWVPHGIKDFSLEPNGKVTAASADRLRLALKPADFSILRLDPDEFSLWELDEYIATLNRKGLDPGGYIVDRDLKYATPVSCLIMVALGMALSLDPLPRHLSLGRSFGLAIAIGFGYWLAFGITSSFGRSGLMSAWWAAWLPNIVFSLIALSIFLFGEER